MKEKETSTKKKPFVLSNKLASDFAEYLKKSKSLDDLKSNFDLDELKIGLVIRDLQQKGYNIVENYRNGSIYYINLVDENKDFSKEIKLETKFNEKDKTYDDFKFMVISDPRLCSKYEQRTILNKLYAICLNENIDTVLLCGDISEGLYNPKSPFFDSVIYNDTQQQADYIIDVYPKVDGITTYFITGEHDATHLKENKLNIGRMISSGRSDLVYIGDGVGQVNVNNVQTLLRHPRDGKTYTISYKTQQFIKSMRSENPIDVVFTGHSLNQDRMIYRGTQSFQVPSIVATTPEMTYKSIGNNVGAYIITYKFNKRGELDHLLWRVIPYYTTIENDYIRAKKYIVRKDDQK